MFGFTTLRTKELESLRNEIKGYYANSDATNKYIASIAAQLRGLDIGSLTYSREDIKRAYETIAPVNGVVSYIADNVGEVSRYLELRDLTHDKFVEHHWVLELLSKPNDRFTRRKFFTAWAINRLLFGDAFVYAPKETGKDRNAKEMYVIPGQNVTIEKGGLTQPLKGIKVAGAETIPMEDNVFESFDYNLDDTSFFGTSKIAAAAVYLSVMDKAMNRQATTLTNGGVANIITPSGNGGIPALPAQIDDMEQKMNARKNANKNIAMKLPIEVHSVGDNPVNLSILDSHKDAINALCFVFKLPVDLYLGQSKYENAKEAKKTIYEQIAIPMVNEFAEDFLHYAGLSDGFELAVNTDKIEVLRDSRADVLDCIEKMHGSLNELREANGYEPIAEDWADKPIMPMGVQFGNEGAFDISEV